MYPEANIWVTGHSLGGGLASLLGVSFGAPVVAFEAPSDRMASRRLHLPQPVRRLFSKITITDCNLTHWLALPASTFAASTTMFVNVL
jgi:putative lipase involved disintegration of autophagic bodies